MFVAMIAIHTAKSRHARPDGSGIRTANADVKPELYPQIPQIAQIHYPDSPEFRIDDERMNVIAVDTDNVDSPDWTPEPGPALNHR
jgi:hypothetical protein